MALPVVWYLREFARAGWLKKFIAAKTGPLVTPPYFRGFPELTGKTCNHNLFCMMACPAPGAIEVVHKGDGWEPRIDKGHCIRCGLCVEACPNGVLGSGRILESMEIDRSALRWSFRIHVDEKKCMGCGNCSVACPVNKTIDPRLSAGGNTDSDEVLMRVKEGKNRVLHEDLCTGCKTCADSCPNDAIEVARILEAIQREDA
jgi:energy-converting hydrogenase A subunit P